jgi:hypothetical protein
MMCQMTCPRIAVLLVLLAALTGAGCAGDDEQPDRTEPVVSDPGPIHVHGLGTNPKDDALFIATHTGLFRLGAAESVPTRVGGRYQDTMGFTVVGPDGFLGSGHPDGREKAPPFLGLIRSGDAGETWQPVSLRGKADFHVLEAANPRIYGFGSDWDTRQAQFLVSDNDGKDWDEREVPEPLISLALRPGDPDRIFAAGERGLYESRDAGRRWTKREGPAGLLGWRRDGLTLVTTTGGVMASPDGKRWRRVGEVGGQPAAFEAEAEFLYVALHDGTIKRSRDGGRTWAIRSQP